MKVSQSTQGQSRQSSLSRPRNVIALMIAVAFAGGLWWVTHPTELGGPGGGVGALAEVGEPVVIGININPDSAIVLRSIEALGAPDYLDISIHACQGGSDIGALRGSVGELCDNIASVSGLVIEPDGGSDWGVVAEAILRDSGIASIDGFTVRYRSGFQWGSQLAGPGLDVYTAGHEPDE